MSKVEFCSFRDPSGFVLKHEGRILRFVVDKSHNDLQELVKSALFKNLIEKRSVPTSQYLSEAELIDLRKKLLPTKHINFEQFTSCIEHEVVSFPSYPYEWAPEMLHCAAQFTLELAERLLEQNLGLKDASPYNVLFQGPNPIFVDILSFEKRDPRDFVWLPYSQFLKMFLLPLIANQKRNIPLSQIFLTKTDGIDPEEVYRLLGARQLFQRGIFSLVTMPTLFSRMQKGTKKESAVYKKKLASSAELAKFILQRMLKGLKRQLKRFAPVQKQSSWTSYFSIGESYNKEEFRVKSDLVTKLLEQLQPKSVLDVGCNTGYFSVLAAKQKANVVAIDSDPAVVGALWRQAKKENLPILPLVVDICRPSPAVGWKNAENLSFLHRAQGTFDTVMMLAVLHHMTVTARIPLEEVASMCASITTHNLIIEFVAPEDPMFRRLLRGRDSLYQHLTKEFFEIVFQRHFCIRSCERVGDASRWLYHLQKQ